MLSLQKKKPTDGTGLDVNCVASDISNDVRSDNHDSVKCVKIAVWYVANVLMPAKLKTWLKVGHVAAI